jgi:hypothetical protein
MEEGDGVKRRAPYTPAFLLSITSFLCASSAVTELFGSAAASKTPWVFNSAAEVLVDMIADDSDSCLRTPIESCRPCN